MITVCEEKLIGFVDSLSTYRQIEQNLVKYMVLSINYEDFEEIKGREGARCEVVVRGKP